MAYLDKTGLERLWQHIISKLGSKAEKSDLISHTRNTSNPHGVTAAQIGAVATDGDAVINGDVSAYSFDVNAEGQHPNISFNDTVNGELNQCGIILFTPKHRVSLEARTQDHAYVEAYQLPTPADTATSNAYYDILTSKTPVKISQGGTGATTVEQARTNLGITDEKVHVEVRDGTTSNATLYPVGVTSGNEITSSVIRYNGISYNITNGDETTVGRAQLLLGNNIPEGTAGNKQGQMSLFSANGKVSGKIIQDNKDADSTQYLTHTLPNTSGTILNTNTYKNYVTPESIGAANIANGQYAVTATSDDGVAYTATVPSITSLTTGVSFIMIPSRTSASTSPTLNVNGLGAKNIKRRISAISTATQVGCGESWIAGNNPFRVIYDGTQWIIEGLTQPIAADLYGTLSVEKGGTGATDAATALSNLGGAPIEHYHNQYSLSSHSHSAIGDGSQVIYPMDNGDTPCIVMENNGQNQFALSRDALSNQNLGYHVYTDGAWAGYHTLFSSSNLSFTLEGSTLKITKS